MKAIILTGSEPSLIYCDIEESEIHDKVKGYIEPVAIRGAIMWVNEDGIRLDLPYNFHASVVAGQPIQGPVVITGPSDAQGRMTDIPHEVFDEIVATFPEGG